MSTWRSTRSRSQQRFNTDSYDFASDREVVTPMINGSTLQGPHTTAAPQAVQRIHVNQLFIRRGRQIMVLAMIQLCLGIQLIIFGMICRFYDGCRFASGILGGIFFGLNACIGLALVKLWPKPVVLNIYTATSILALLLSVCLFTIVAILLHEEQEFLEHSWDPAAVRFKAGVNRLVENTKIAMYAVQLVLDAVHLICSLISTIICCRNQLATPNGPEVHKGYYVTQSPIGHQTMLVPVEVTNARPPEEVPLLSLPKASSGTQTSFVNIPGFSIGREFP